MIFFTIQGIVFMEGFPDPLSSSSDILLFLKDDSHAKHLIYLKVSFL